jgi:hypothetical protein
VPLVAGLHPFDQCLEPGTLTPDRDEVPAVDSERLLVAALVVRVLVANQTRSPYVGGDAGAVL